MVRLVGNAVAGTVAGTVAGAVTVGLVGLAKFTDAGAQELNFVVQSNEKEKKQIEHERIEWWHGMGVGDHKFKNAIIGSLRNCQMCHVGQGSEYHVTKHVTKHV